MKPQLKKWLEEQTAKVAMESAEGVGKPIETTDKVVTAELETPEDLKEGSGVVEPVVGKVSVEDADDNTSSDEVLDTEVVSETTGDGEQPAIQEENTGDVEVPGVVTPVEENTEVKTDKLVTDPLVTDEVVDAPIEKPEGEETVPVSADETVPESDNGVVEESADATVPSTEEAESEEALMIEDATTGVVDQQREIEDVAADIDTLEGSQVAMERYIEILKEAQEEGGLNQHAASILRVNLEQFEKRFGLEKQVTPSLEAFGGTMSQKAATVVSIEGIKEVVEMIKKAIAAAWAQLKAFIQELVTKFKLSVGTYEKKIKSLQEAVKSIPKEAKGTTFSVSNPAMLMADGEWYGNEKGVATLAGIGNFVFEFYPGVLVELMGVIRNDLSIDKIDNLEAMTKAGEVAEKAMSDADGALPDGDTSQDKGYTTRTVGPIFGNKLLAFKAASAGYDFNRTPVEVAIMDAEKAKPAPTSYELNPDQTSFEKRLSGCGVVVEKMKKFASKHAEIQNASKQLIDKAEQIRDEIAKGDMDGDNLKKFDALTRIINAGNVLNAKYTGVISYVGKVLSMQLTVIEQEIKSFKTE